MFSFIAETLGQVAKLGVKAVDSTVEDILDIPTAFEKGYNESWLEEEPNESEKSNQEPKGLKL